MTISDVNQEVTELIGVYNADSGITGEAAYLIGKLLGTRHCALCDITHSPIRRKPEWDRMAATLRVPFSLDHLNDTPRDVRKVVNEQGAPIVLGRLFTGGLVVLLTADELELEGSVSAFAEALEAKVAVKGLHLAHPYRTPVVDQSADSD